MIWSSSAPAPAATSRAIRAAQLGMKVACVEKDARPSAAPASTSAASRRKALLDFERALRARAQACARAARRQGRRASSSTRRRCMARKDKVVEGATPTASRSCSRRTRSTRVYGSGAHRRARQGRGRTATASTTLEAEAILIATGSRAVAAPGRRRSTSKHIVSSDRGAVASPTVPERLLVVGGGDIGLELGSVWARLGVEGHGRRVPRPRSCPAWTARLATALQRSSRSRASTFQPRTQRDQARDRCDGERASP